jgi:hypothetical protein
VVERERFEEWIEYEWAHHWADIPTKPNHKTVAEFVTSLDPELDDRVS